MEYLWWAVDGVLAGMGMPYVALDRRMNHGGTRDAFEDELPGLYAKGIRAVVCLLNIPSDASVFESAGFRFRCFPIADGLPPDMNVATQFLSFVDACRKGELPVVVF